MLGVAASSLLGVLSVRPEWSKGAAYDAKGRPWRDANALADLRSQYRAFTRHGLEDVVARLDAIDPQRSFRSPLARLLMHPGA